MVGICPKCGRGVPSDAPGELCPSCLFAGGLTTENVLEEKNPVDSDPQSTMHIVLPEEIRLPGNAPVALGKYEILEEIARGGMGIVYKARHVGLDNVVAVKVIRSGVLASPAAVERFQREARAAASLHHPNIVAIHDIGEQDGALYFSMDYVPGANLANLSRLRPFAPRAAAEIAAAVGSAIHYAHQQGVLHRDLKPANVILTPEQQPRVLDFGLARLAKDHSELTQSGAPMGTPGYMPPEQAAGRSDSIDARSDVYALGALLYELLTSRPPFQAASTVEILKLVLESEPVPPRRLNPALPLDLETICLRCLEKEPGRRYSNAQEFADELGRFLRNEPIRARPANQVEKAVRWCKRKPVIASLAAAVVFLLIAVAFSSTLAALRITAARNTARRNLYAADMKEVQQAWESGNARRAVNLLRAHIPRRGQEDLRGFEWSYFWKLCQGEQEFVFQGHESPVGLVAYAADGRTILSHSSDGILHVWDAAHQQQEPIKTQNFDKWDAGSATSADGKVLAICQAAEIKLFDRDSLQMQGQSFRHESAVGYHLALSPDHGWLAAACQQGELLAWRIADRQLRRKRLVANETVENVSIAGDLLVIGGRRGSLKMWRLTSDEEVAVPANGDRQSITSMAFSPDGQGLAVARGTTIQLLSLTTNSLTLSILRTGSNIDELSSLAFSPDGRSLAAGTLSGVIELWDVPEGRRTRSLHGHTGRVTSMAFSPQGNRLVSGSEDATVRLWNLSVPAEKQLFHVGNTANVIRAALAPDGTNIAFGHSDGTITLWDTTTKTTQATLVGHQQAVLALTYSPDGNTLASASGDDRNVSGGGEVRLWDAVTGRMAALLPDLTNIVSAVAFSRDGRTLALACPYAPEIWDVTSLREIAFFPGYDDSGHKDLVRAVAFAPGGSILVSGSSDKTIRLWSRSSQVSTTLPGVDEAISCLAFSKDGRLLAASGDGLLIGVWDFRTRKRLATLEGHKVRAISALAFSSDTKTLASGGADGTVRLWNLAARREVATFDARPSAVVGVFFNQAGTTLLSVSADGAVRSWSIQEGTPGATARSKAATY